MTRRTLATVALLSFVFACGDEPADRDRRVTTDNGSDMGTANNGATNNGGNNGATNNGATNNGSGDDMGGSAADMGSGGDDVGTGGEDMGTGGEDMGTGGEDMGNELPSGEICPYTDLEPFVGLCDPVRVTGCSVAGEECLPAVRIIGSEAKMSGQCADATNNTLPVGENCQDTEQRCAPGSACITFYGECRKLCYPDTSLGCDPGEFCRRPSASWEGLGFCDSTCNL